jgi:site-specific DNA-cytosine methylase
MEIQKIVYDDYNSAIRADQRTMATPTTNCGVTALRNGVKIIEAAALRMVRTEEGKRLRKAYESHEVHHGYNEHRKAEPRTDGVCNTLTTVQKDNYILETSKSAKDVPEIFHKFIYEIDGELYLIRIRKLTPLECWRLMGFYDSNYEKASSVNSNTQLYKQAGNSIVKQVLMAVFSQMVKPQDSRTVLKRKALALLDLL